MTLCEAYKFVNSKGITPWMAYGILKWNDGYCIFHTQEIKRFPDLDYVYIRKGEAFPKKPISTFKPIKLRDGTEL